MIGKTYKVKYFIPILYHILVKKVILILEIALLIMGFVFLGFFGALSSSVSGQNNHIFSNEGSMVKITPFVQSNNSKLGHVKYTIDLVNNTLLNGNNNLIGNGICPQGIAFDPLNGNLYVANYCSSNVSIINGTTNKVIGSVYGNSFHYGIAFDPLNGNLYVANYCSSNVSIINGTTNNVIGSVNAGHYPYGIAFDSSNGKVYVSNFGSNNVSIINGTTNKVIGNVSVGTAPEGMAFDPKLETYTFPLDESNAMP